MRRALVTTTDGLHLATTAVGPSDAPSILLGHGVASSPEFVLDALAPPLVGEGWQVVAHDLRGHGASSPCRDPGDYAVDRLVEDLAVLVAAHTPRVIGGVSLSAHVAVHYAVRQDGDTPVLACLPAWTGQSLVGVGPHAAVADGVEHTGVGGVIAGFGADSALRPWLRSVLTRDWSKHDEASLVAALRSLDGGLAPTSEQLAALAAPLALVGWPDDPGHPLDVARQWEGLAPRAALATLRLVDLDLRLTAFGEAAAAALRAVGVTP